MLYLSILLEAAAAHSILPLGGETTFYAMRGFGGFNLTLAAALAFAGSMLGLTFNWGLGRLILSRYRKGDFNLNPDIYEKAARMFTKYGVWLLLLGWVSLLNIVPLIAGFLRVPLKIALPLMMAGQAGFYIFQCI